MVSKLFRQLFRRHIRQVSGRFISYTILDLYLGLHIRSVPVRGCRPFRAASLTHIGLDEAVIQLPFLQAFQHLHAVLQTVHKHLMVTVRILLRNNRLDHAAADRIEPVDLRIRIAHGLILAGCKVYTRFGKPVRQLLKSKDRVDGAEHPVIPDGLLLLRNARAQKYDLYIRSVNLLNITSMSHHGRHYRSHQFRAVRIVFLDQVVDTGTAGRDDIRHPVLPHQLLVLIGHQRRALRRFPDFVKAQLLQSIHHLSRLVKFQDSRIGRSDGDDGLKSLPQISFHTLKITCESLGILGTDFQAASAVDTVIHHDAGLFILDCYCLHRTVPHTLIAVTAFRVLKVYDFHLHKPPRSLLSIF